LLQPLLWVSTLTNQFVDLVALLFPKRTDVSMPHGKIQFMFMSCLNVALVEAPPSTNLQDIMCIHNLSCKYCIFLYHTKCELGSWCGYWTLPPHIMCIFKLSWRYYI
jgi:hypothetical protein